MRWNHPAKCTWICWGCKRSGNSISLIQALERVDLLGAIDVVVSGYVGGTATGEMGLIHVRSSAPRKILPMPWPAGVDLLDARNPKHAKAVLYLSSRGISPEKAKEYRIGVGVSGRFSNYVVFPVYEDGLLMYFQGRATWDPPTSLGNEARKAWVKATNYRKTLNPTSSEDHATAQDALFNYDKAKHHSTVVICEGPVDAIKVGPNAVALFGKSPSLQKIAKLKEMSALEYIVYLDRGEEERAQAEKLASELSAVANVRIATPPEGHDPGSLSTEANAAVLRLALPWDSVGALKALLSFQ